MCMYTYTLYVILGKHKIVRSLKAFLNMLSVIYPSLYLYIGFHTHTHPSHFSLSFL